MKRIIILLILLITFISFSQVKSEKTKSVTVFEMEVIDGVEYGYRIPALIVSRTGTLLAFAERRVGLHDHAQNDIVLKRSTDNGNDWESMQVIADMGKKSLNDPCAVVLESGRILLMYQMFPYGIHTINSGWIQMADNGYDGPRNTKTFMVYSDDDGKTWSDPKDMTKIIRPVNRISVGSPGIGIQLSRGDYKGRIIFPLYFTRRLNERVCDWTNAVGWSDDEGVTWQISNDIQEIGHTGKGNEAQVVELSDGSIMFIARNQGGFFRKYSISRDGGSTWENMRVHYELPGVACQGSILRYSFGKDEENLIIHSNPANRYSRTDGTVRLSYDDGQSWKVGREVAPSAFFAYSCLAKLKDDRIGLLYETDNYRKIDFISFSPDWVKAEDEIKTADYYSIPTIDLDNDIKRQTIVDREKGQYLGHVTTVLLEDGKTMIAVYPKGHGKGAIVMKRSSDGGITWSNRLPTPKSWETSKEVPTIYRVVDASGKKRLILFSGLYPTRMAVSEDDGRTWSELNKVGDWGGIVVMGCLIPLQTGGGHYMALFHDDKRFMTRGGILKYKRDQENHNSPMMTLLKSYSYDGGLSWSYPEEIYKSREVHLCEPGFIRSPDGEQIAVFLRENSRRSNSHIIFSNDNGMTWTQHREMPNTLNGDRHTAKYTPDGRIIIVFRDRSPDHKFRLNEAVNLNEVNMKNLAEKAGYVSPTYGDWVAWVGTYEDLVMGNEGQYRIRIKDNKKGADTTYPGVEILPDGTISTTTYGHWEEGEEPYILNVRFKLEEIDELATKQKK
ncbi:exo-alpha-sialidase [Bacteroidota bacterium]